MRLKKKILCSILTICMILAGITVTPQTAQAAESDFVIQDGKLTTYTGNSKNVTIPSSVKVIGAYAFQWNSSVTNITVPKSVTLCETGCFANCISLKSITFKNKNTKLNYDSVEAKDSWEESVFYIGKYVDSESYPIFKKVHSSTLTIKGYKNSTAQKLAKKLVTYPYGYKSVKFTNLTTKKSTTYGVKIANKLNIKKGKSTKLSVTLPTGLKKVSANAAFEPTENGTWENTVTVKYKSSNKNIATVNSNGKITAKRKGTVKITTTVSWGADRVFHNTLGDSYTFQRTYTTTVTVK